MSNFQVYNTILDDAVIIEPKIFVDDRGFFFESYREDAFYNSGIKYDFVQDNYSFSNYRHTLRGLHYQLNPAAQATYVRVVSGAILDVVVDIRKSSPTYKRHFKVELSAENKKILVFGKGFAHGFLTLTDNVGVCYKMDAFYSEKYDRTILWNDAELCIDWGCDLPILSQKDAIARSFIDSEQEINFA